MLLGQTNEEIKDGGREGAEGTMKMVHHVPRHRLHQQQT
jgi:hypothetical protein